MPARRTDKPRKLKETPPPLAGGLPFPDLIRVYEAMASQDPGIVFDSTRPLADEFWNLIDGRRSIAEIASFLCLEFGFTLEPDSFLPFADHMVKSGLIALEASDS